MDHKWKPNIDSEKELDKLINQHFSSKLPLRGLCQGIDYRVTLKRHLVGFALLSGPFSLLSVPHFADLW